MPGPLANLALVRHLERIAKDADEALIVARDIADAGDAAIADIHRLPEALDRRAAAHPRLFTPVELALGMVGTMEAAGADDNPQVVAFLQSCRPDATRDAVPWCSGFCAWCCKAAGYERSRSLRARSWLRVGLDVADPADVRGGDVVVFRRGRGRQPGPEIIDAPGHVAFVAATPGAAKRLQVVGGNQGDRVSLKHFPASAVLGFRRLRRVA